MSQPKTGVSRLPPWHELVRLPDGREWLIRPVQPEDAAPIHAAFALLQPEEIRHRFFHTVKELEPELVQRLVRPTSPWAIVLVAAEPMPPGEAMIAAVANAIIQRDTREAEFAILVGHFIAGQGMGRRLMRKLVRWARNRKLACLSGDVLESNRPMLALTRSLGFHIEYSGEPGVMRVTLDLAHGQTLQG